MRIGLNQGIRMGQRLVQSPQMIQAMQVLQLSTLDLSERIEQELIENPLLEIADPESSDEPTEAKQDEPDTEFDNMVEMLERYESDFGDGRSRAAGVEASERKLEMMQNTASDFRSLADDLIAQLAIIDFTPEQRDHALFLIYSLDGRGFLPDSLEELSVECGATLEELEDILLELRYVSHPALGAHDLRECLLLQLAAHGIRDQLEAVVVRDHLEDLITNRLPHIVRATNSTLDEVKAAIDTIRHLDPSPAQDYGNDPVNAITPDVMVIEIMNSDPASSETGNSETQPKYEVTLTRERIPSLQVSPSYRKMLLGSKRGDAVQQWVKRRVEAARWFIDAIYQRRSTMLKIADVIFEVQKGFLEKGVQALKPLRMQEVADEAGVHISTVSRAVAGKYAQTPQGIHPLKFFFTGGLADSSGGVSSQTTIKEQIGELVAAENKEHPYSDEELSELMHEKHGIKIARRTVTKYRKLLELPASSQRREY
ncbi:MAG: RNA polymerase sigma-54 factor [Planctomycetota bacterium]|jgi:RNA polymerase sigma-54 factor